VASWYWRRHSVEVSREWVVMLPFGARAALSLVLRTVLTPGQAVVTLSPSYPGIRKVIKGAQCSPVEVELEKTHAGYIVNWDALAQSLRAEAVGAFVLCSPHNPTGRVWSSEELARMKLLCDEFDVCLISDEVHSDLVYRHHRHTPAIAGERASAPVVTIHSPGKGFNVSGIPGSFALVPDDRLRGAVVAELGAAGFHQGGLLCDLVHEACFAECEQWLDVTLGYLEETRDTAMSRIEAASDILRCLKPEATFLLWLDFSPAGLKETQLEDLLVGRAKVGLLPGRAFGAGGESHFRLNMATSRSRVMSAIDAVIWCAREGAALAGAGSNRYP
jgi:cysteine-S-conjugate beta-lyase